MAKSTPTSQAANSSWVKQTVLGYSAQEGLQPVPSPFLLLLLPFSLPPPHHHPTSPQASPWAGVGEGGTYSHINFSYFVQFYCVEKQRPLHYTKNGNPWVGTFARYSLKQEHPLSKTHEIVEHTNRDIQSWVQLADAACSTHTHQLM